MSMDNSNEQFDTNSEPRKADVLRAKDIIPPLRTPARPEPDTQQAGQKAPIPPAEVQKQPEKEPDAGSLPEISAEQIKPVEGIPVETTTTEQPKSDIPRFSLADKIMAEQRRITAVRRKGPGQEEIQEQEREVEPVGSTKEHLSPALSEQKQIIAEIVARDIESLCRGDTWGGRKREFQGQE